MTRTALPMQNLEARAMNKDIRAARELLTELREVYQGLPQIMRERIAHLLRALPLLELNRDTAN